MSEVPNVLRVRVMDWIMDTPTEQQANIELFQSFSNIRHLEIRLTGWTINQNSRLHVGINTVPALLGGLPSTLEELTIDMECLSRDSTLSTFCNLISTPSTTSSLQTLAITCSGEEDMKEHSWRELGRAFQSLSSITTLKLAGIDPDHLSSILYNMQAVKSCLECCVSCPCLTDNQKPCPCPRVLPQRSRDMYQVVGNPEEDEDVIMKDVSISEGYPKNLELHRVRLFPYNIANLVHLLADEQESSIAHLTLRDCVLTTEDLGFLNYLLKGHSVLQELTLERLRLRTFAGTPPWWNTPCTRPVPKAIQASPRLHTVRLLDCKGSKKDLEQITDALVGPQQSLKTLVLQYSSSETSSMTIHALNALYMATVVHNHPCSLRQLQVSAGPHAESYRLQQLVTLLGHSFCRLEKLTLDLGAGPYHLDVLGDQLTENTHLAELALSGDEELTVGALQCFVSMLEEAPQLKALELDFPGIRETNLEVLKVFKSNTTLEDVRIVGGGSNGTTDAPTHFFYLGLRNRLGTHLRSRPEWRIGTWKDVLGVLLEWQSHESRLSLRGKELVLTSGIWFALMECPLMVSELAPLEQARKRSNSCVTPDIDAST